MRNPVSKTLAILRLFTIALFLFSVTSSFAQETALFQWVNTIGTTGSEGPRDIAIDPNGNIFTAGYLFQTPIDLDPGAGEYLANQDGASFISKVDNNGSFLWAKEFLTHTSGYIMPVAIVTDAAGAVYMTGELFGTVDFDPGTGVFELTSGGTDDVFFCKLDANGNFVLAKLLASPGADEQPKDIKIDGSGNIYLSGSHRGFIDFDPGAGTFTTPIPAGAIGTFYCKYDLNGNLVWAKTIHYPGISGFTMWPGGESIALDASGNIYSCGAFRQTMDFDPGAGTFNLSSAGGNEDDIYILKLDNNGGFVWAKSIGNNVDETANSIGLDGQGGVYVTGHYSTLATDFDPGSGVTTISGDKLYLLKLDVNGNFTWAKSFGGGYQMLPYVMLDGDANVYITGAFALGPADFDPGAGVFNLDAEVWDTFTTKLTKDGDFVWAVSFGSPTYFETPVGAVMDAAKNIFIMGQFGDTSDFDPSSCVYNVVGKGGPDMYTIKLKQAISVSAPTISSFSPTAGPLGTTVTITGTNFSPTPSANVVKFFNNRTATVTASTPTSLTVTVPAGTTTGKISVTVNCLTGTSATDFTIGAAVGPTITSFSPQSGLVGTTVTITGTNFSTTPANNIVKLNGTNAVVTASTATSITTTVPAGATTGKFTVTVGANTATSANNFTVTQPGGNNNEPPQIAESTTTIAINGNVNFSVEPLLSDADDNIDLESLYIASDPISGAPAELDSDHFLTIDYTNSGFSGTDRLTLGVCDLEGECTEREIFIVVGTASELAIFNAISPNGDGKNDIFYLQAIDASSGTADNKVTIYNRWGDVVFETTNYNNTTNVFKGLSKNGNELPSGNYFYKIVFPNGGKNLTGFLSLKR